MTVFTVHTLFLAGDQAPRQTPGAQGPRLLIGLLPGDVGAGDKGSYRDCRVSSGYILILQVVRKFATPLSNI